MGDQILSMLSRSLQFALTIWNTYIEPYAGWWFTAVIICTVYRFLLHPLLAGGWGSDPVRAVKQIQANKRNNRG